MTWLISEALQYLAEVKQETLVKKSTQSGISLDKLNAWNDLLGKGLLKPEDKQLEQIKTESQLDIILGKYVGVKTKTKIKKENLKDAKLVFENDKVRVYSPRTEQASCILGKGTKWCTAATNDNKFNQYAEQGVTLYYLIPKTPGELKYAVAVYDDPEIIPEVYDDLDEKFDFRDFDRDILKPYGIDPKIFVIDVPEDKLDDLFDNIKLHGKQNQDGSWDFAGDILLKNKPGLTGLPFKLGKLTGSLIIEKCPLTSLKNFPDIIEGDLILDNTKITNLVGCPVEVGKSLKVLNSPDLISLEGCAKKVTGSFLLIKADKLKSLEGGPTEVGNTYAISSVDISSLKGCPREVPYNFIVNYTGIRNLVGGPEKVGRHYIVGSNLLKTLEGCPKDIPGTFDVKNNFLVNIDDAPEHVGGDLVVHSQNYRGITEADWDRVKVDGRVSTS